MIFFILCIEDQSPMQHSIGKNNREFELKVLDRFDETWKHHINILRMNENRLIRRNVPRLMLFSNDCKLIYFNMSFKN